MNHVVHYEQARDWPLCHRRASPIERAFTNDPGHVTCQRCLSWLARGYIGRPT